MPTMICDLSTLVLSIYNSMPSMICVLMYPVFLAETGVLSMLAINTPLRKLMILGLDLLNRGRGPAILKIVFTVIIFLILYSLYVIFDISIGDLPSNHLVRIATHVYQALLLGNVLAAARIIDNCYHEIREHSTSGKRVEVATKQSRTLEEFGESDDINVLAEDIAWLKAQFNDRKAEIERKKLKVEEAEAIKKLVDALSAKYSSLLEEIQQPVAVNQCRVAGCSHVGLSHVKKQS